MESLKTKICFIIFILFVFYLTFCPKCGWPFTQALSVKHGGMFHYDCLMGLEK